MHRAMGPTHTFGEAPTPSTMVRAWGTDRHCFSSSQVVAHAYRHLGEAALTKRAVRCTPSVGRPVADAPLLHSLAAMLAHGIVMPGDEVLSMESASGA